MTWSLSSSLLALAACTKPAAEPTVETTQKALSGPAPVLAATAPSASTVALDWTDVVGETGYYVERSTDGGQTFTQVQTLAADATDWTDTGRSPLTTYCYRVRAFDADGSLPSNARCVLVPKGYEAESLGRTTSSASASTISDAGASGGSLVSATVSTVGGWVELATTTPATGVYGTKIRYLAAPDAGRFVVKVGGVVYGSEVDGYVASPVFRELYLGEANILAAPASRKLRFELTGSNPASTGNKIQIDVITMYVAQFRYEGESSGATTSSGDSQSNGNVNAASNGKVNAATLNAVGDFVRYTIAVGAPGTYSVDLRIRKGSNRGRFDAWLDESTAIGGEVDGYAASNTLAVVPLGELTIAAGGSHTVKLRTTGKNASASGYGITVDAIDLRLATGHGCSLFGDAIPDGTVCDDASLCTQNDVCQAGVCVGSTSEVCTASDQCHDVGVCDPATGQCSNPPKADGTGCSDGDACTEDDACQAGSCRSGAPVTCIASDSCHDVGTCDPGTGQCSNPAKLDGTGCDDGNHCTQTDSCLDGTCTGGNPVTCTALDQCHDVGSCDPGSGQCSQPAKADGTLCSDGDACTQIDTCQAGSCAGGNPVTCTALDQCHDVGSCDPGSGQCSQPAKPDGAGCNDGNACTQTDTCQTGTCTGSDPVTCTALDQCHDVGSCDPGSGQCSQPAKPDGTGCNDGNACTQTDLCQAGTCAGGNAKQCTALDQCHDVGTCDPGSGDCGNPVKPDGTACNDGNACTQTDTCQTGACTGTNPKPCAANDQCHDIGTCDPGSGQCSNPAKADGTGCSDGNACTQTDTCQGGACGAGSPVACQPSDPCHLAGSCEQGAGQCTNPERPGVCPGPVGTRLSVGSSRNCAIRTDGTVACWGHNPGGVTPPAGTFVQVSVGQYRTFGVRDDGTLACWGRFCGTLPAAAFRQVSAGGDWQCGLALDRTALCWGAGAPAAPAGSFAQIGTGWRHACALRDDATAVCWGDDDYGQARAPADAFVQIAVGMFHACGLHPDGSVTCWGDNGSGQLSVPAGSFTAIAAGARHTCALDGQQVVVCWGDDQYGQASPPSGTFIDVAAGEYHSCGVRSDGAIACWGAGDYGLTSPPVGQFTQVAFSPMFGSACWIRPGGSVMCWGGAWAGELTPPPALFAQLTMGGTHSCGLRLDGTAVCWGDNTYGQSDPVEGTFLQVAASYNQTCYLRADHTAFCRGDAYAPQLPEGQYDFIATGGDCACGRDLTGAMRCTNHVACIPLAGMADVQQVSLGRYHRCALQSSGTITCWGDGSFGQLAVPAGTYTEVSVGDYHTCGLRTDGTVACWGGAHLAVSPPAGTFLHLSSGYETTCGVTGAGQQSCWGLYARQPIDGDDPAAAPCIGKVDGASCGDGNACTQTDVCAAGFCVGTQAVICAPNPCSETTKCNPGTGQCPIRPIADGTACDDNPCTSGKTCQQGVCSGGSALPDGMPCSDGMLCTDGDVCQSGSCTGNQVVCAADQCHEPGTCDPGTGLCSSQGLAKPDGTACNDGNMCTGPDACQAGTCTSGPPVECSAATSTRLSAGTGFTCAIRDDGSVACWGANQMGEATPPSGTFKDLSAATGWACGLLTDGSPRCWGGYPSQYAPTWGSFVQIATGSSGGCALGPDGLAICWGSMGSPPSGLTQIAVGYYHGCGVTTAGTVACWGANDSGQTDAPAGTFAQVVAGGYHACGLRLDGIAECWGQDATAYPPPTATFVRLAAAGATTCGLTTSGEIMCWGGGDVAHSAAPLGPFVSLTVGADHACATRPDGAMACWGQSYQGSDWLGATSPPLGQFQEVATAGQRGCRRDAQGHVHCWGGGAVPPAEVVIRQVAVGNQRVCGILADGSGRCWCDADYECMQPFEPVRQVAMGGFDTDGVCWIRIDGSITCSSMPQGYPPPGSFKQVAVGGDAACAVRDDGTLACWGYDSGWGVTTPPAGTFEAVAVGEAFACAVRTGGELACWGYNGDGQAAPPPGQFAAVATGGYAGCGLKVDGSILCWGGGPFHPLVSPTGPFRQLAGSDATFCAVSTSGQEWCWGQVARQPLACAVEPDGVCISTDPVVCAPTDQCHGPGTFDPVTRRCNESVMPDGTACNDGNACTQTDTCQGGVCAGGNAVVCSAPPWNPCETSTCEPATGQCVMGFLPDGAACVDNNPCTENDTCQSGWCSPGTSVICVPDDIRCQTGGTCDPSTGQCQFVPLPDGFACEDGNHCTRGDGCQGGLCVAGPPVACAGEGDCYQAGTCDPTSGQCAYPAKAEGESCDDRNACTQNDLCQAGSCMGAAVGGTCEPPTGARLAAGSRHTCALRPDGTMSCWGTNDYGESIPPSGSWKQITAGQSFTCGLRMDGSPVCWGNPSSPATTPMPGPYAQLSGACGLTPSGHVECWGGLVPPADVMTQISVGDSRGCGLRLDGSIACWGNWYESPPAGVGYRKVAVDWTGCAIKADQSIVCWDGSMGAPPAGEFADVELGEGQACGVRTNGALACWGLIWGTVPPGSFVAVSVAYLHACAMRGDGSVVCWGLDTAGEATVPSGTFYDVAAGPAGACGSQDGMPSCWGLEEQRPPSTSYLGRYAAGGYAYCALTMWGYPMCWGFGGEQGQPVPWGAFAQIAVGYSAACGVRDDGSVGCWGGTIGGSSSPPGGTFSQVTVGGNHACALLPDGSVTCWGNNDSGQATPPPGSFTYLAAGTAHTCGLGLDGSIACWGNNDSGRATPPGGNDFVKLSAADAKSCALTSAGTAVCWGVPSPGDAFGGSTLAGPLIHISVGAGTTCALNGNGQQLCWGNRARQPL